MNSFGIWFVSLLALLFFSIVLPTNLGLIIGLSAVFVGMSIFTGLLEIADKIK